MNRPEAGPVALEARNVCFHYAAPVVQDFSLALRRGEVTGIIGPNGSGKTTILRILDGILRPASGSVLLGGRTPVSAMTRRQIARHISMVPQNGRAYSFHSVFQFAMQGRSAHLPLLGFETAGDEAIVHEALAWAHMDGYEDARADQLSGGEKQRLLLARALAQQPEILLLDELTANLDVNYQVDIMRLIRRLTRERSLATAVVSHEINLLAAFSDRVVLVKEGRIRHQGEAGAVVTHENLQELFGLNFRVHLLPNGVPEVLPIMHDERG